MVSTRLVAIAALLLAIGYLAGTRGSRGTADSELARNAVPLAADTATASAAAPPAMDRAAFWGLIERARAEEQAYTWDIWGAAYVIEDGCSDDCFRDFRAYLISLGPRAFAAALRDPDSLAPIVKDAEEGDWENADDVAPDAYQTASGDDFPADSSDLSGSPRGKPWDDESQEALVQRYPALAARFR